MEPTDLENYMTLITGAGIDLALEGEEEGYEGAAEFDGDVLVGHVND